MDLNFTPEEEAFRQEVRDFFAETSAATGDEYAFVRKC